jgi:hypothetical protein
MTQNNVTNILRYHGALNFEKIEELLTQFRQEIRPFEIDVVIRKRIFSILVECLENTFRHNVAISHKTKHHSVEFVLNDMGSIIGIELGNYVKNSKVQSLKSTIDAVNALNHDELNKLYRESIAVARISEKGGAGLGIIEIARNSRNALKYEFEEPEGNYSFFKLGIIIKKQQ